jgi:hypothetical protein
MDGHETGSLARDVEAVVRRIPGVSATRVELGDGGRVDQIHVLGSSDRSVRWLVSQIIAAVGAELGVTLEPAQVRVALQRPGQTEPGPAPVRARLKFSGLTVTTLRDAQEAKVRIEQDGLTYEGAASGPAGASQSPGVVGLAALRAVETYLRCDGVFQLKAATLSPLGAQQVALALVAWLGPEEEILSGIAIIRDDPREAVARAVLDAVNRPVSWLETR